MSVIINTTKSELEEVIRYARIGANNCMIANSWEVTELVRCKYCEHWKREENQCGDYFCAFNCNQSYREDFYCADGERREELEKETKTDHWGYERLFCPNCKAQYTKGQRFCDNCGQKLI